MLRPITSRKKVFTGKREKPIEIKKRRLVRYSHDAEEYPSESAEGITLKPKEEKTTIWGHNRCSSKEGGNRGYT